MVRTSLCIAALVVAGCGSKEKPAVKAFSVTPLACKGDPVTVAWEVVGRASLASARGGQEVQRTAGDWTEDATIKSKDQKSLPATETTTYRITALDANEADGNTFPAQAVVVPTAPMPRGNTATCDAAGHCTTTITLEAPPTLKVKKLSVPRLAHAGAEQDATICVAHEGLAAPACVAPTQVVPVDLAAGGAWTLTTDVPPGTARPLLKLTFDFGCP